MSNRVVHVRPEGAVWRVELDGHQPRTIVSVELAIAFARGLAQEAHHGEVRIHYGDGSTQSEFFGEPEAADGGSPLRADTTPRPRLDFAKLRSMKHGGRGPGPGKRR